MYDNVAKIDPELGQALKDEWRRQETHIELIASENFVAAEILAIALVRTCYLLRQTAKCLPKGSKVERIGGRPVLRFPFLRKKPEKHHDVSTTRPRDHRSAGTRRADPSNRSE